MLHLGIIIKYLIAIGSPCAMTLAGVQLQLPSDYIPVIGLLSSGQTESQVEALWIRKLSSKFARKSTHVFYRLATQPKSTQVERRPLT